ncbi:murein hydrolase activator EnvC family protein [Variovorax rhizosphaerae]|uniref:Peptidoglycan DD-metalloendopeptidase family protein n=1 Tax=Variovorax rhizosphaerae TaxID=1836200 RepID=A0ABU8WX66_9BURK
MQQIIQSAKPAGTMHHVRSPFGLSLGRFRISFCAVAVLGIAGCATERVPLPPLPPLPSPTIPAPAPMPAPPVASPRPAGAYLRPAPGPIVGRYDQRNKGLDIAGVAGEPVLASRDGRVVLVSSALPEYGTMVVVKHDDTFITAYAHVGKVLVKEDEVVRQGQQIAEMGSTGTNRVKLHFEIRKQGVAQDPEPYLRGELR